MDDERASLEGVANTDKRRDALVGRLFDATLGMMDLLTIYIGDRLGYYRVPATTPCTSSELAAATATNERYGREWLEQQAVTGILEVLDEAATGERRYHLPSGHLEVLLDRDSVAYMTPLARQMVGSIVPLPAILAAFRTGGGVPYASYGPDMREGIASANRALFVNLLGREWLPAIPALHARLLATPSGQVVDIGCGTGWSSIAIARAYPHVRIDGVDLDPASIETATANAAAEGLADRVTFGVRDAADPTLARRYDLALAIECIHDMARPVATLRAMRDLVRAGGMVLVIDERVAESFTAPGDAIERLYYGFSLLHCLPVGMADPPSAETGTIMRPEILRRYALEAGYRDLAILPIEHDLWRFYHLLT